MQLFLFCVIICNMNELKTILRQEEYFFEEKKSKFFSYIFPISNEEEAKKYISEYRKKYSDARHVLWAYSLSGNLKKNNDGEPTGAQAILNAITQNSIDNVLIIVVRYFGGILLGAGGLFRAYGNSACEVIKKCEIVNLVNHLLVEVYCDYNSYLFVQKNYRVVDCNYGENVTLKIAVLEAELDNLKEKNYNFKIVGECLL